MNKDDGGREEAKRDIWRGRERRERRRRYGEKGRREKEGKSSLARLGVICRPLHSS